jgi:hypothetical protein
MKIIAVAIIVYLVFFTNMTAVVNTESWQFPLWIADISWVELELIAAFAVIIIAVSGAVLITLGCVGAGCIALAGSVLAWLFGSLMIAWPLVFIAALCWLVADNKKVAS